MWLRVLCLSFRFMKLSRVLTYLPQWMRALIRWLVYRKVVVHNERHDCLLIGSVSRLIYTLCHLIFIQVENFSLLQLHLKYCNTLLLLWYMTSPTAYEELDRYFWPSRNGIIWKPLPTIFKWNVYTGKHHMSSTARPLADALWCPCSDFVIMPYKFIYYYRQAWAKHSHAGIVFTQ